MPRPRPERSLTLPDDAPPRPAPDPDLAATLSAALPVALADGLPGGLPGVDWPDFGDHDDCARRAVAAVAAMLGRPVPERPKDPRTSAEWLARRWDVDESALVNVSRDMSRTLQRLHGYALQRWIDRHADDVAVFGPGGAPQRAALDLGNGTSVSVPAVATVLFPAGSAYDSAVAVEVAYRYGTPTVTAFTPPGGLALAERVLADLTRTLETDHPYRGGVLSARSSTGSVELTPVTHTPQARGDVVLPADLWREVDLFCSSVTTRRDALRALGHTTSRGLLLAGRPGVGKTKLARVIATELAGPLTVVLVTAEVLRTWMTELYDEIRGLGPCLVVLEEIDSVAAKGSRGDTSFAEFLDALDGTRSSDDVLTLATTNDPDALDPAVKRPGRFDTIVEVPPPDQDGRTEILRLFLPPGTPVDVALVASFLDGATGADLREVARRSILEHGPDDLTTERVADVATSGRWKPAPVAGNYL
ncbi:AAA family ATPase [Promicromonospora thailandica]|uniref:ATPase family associated with various cellular activities (AAA) n=1 Tax=Promicromonospora thailandica TaxID=765201 RepID=A0A9X2FX40_9MICO|nr:ATP-binding protein [Promicromonospora thailandica]MCP2262930.1 ATPase family associated with various cellular activities (AAA) [Promicromonospora thailandica]